MKTFKEQYDKLVTAYLQDKVKPSDSCACFVGNLLNGTRNWRIARKQSFSGGENLLYNERYAKEGIIEIFKESEGTYNLEDISLLEDVFMNTWCDMGATCGGEEAIYVAFEKALLELKKIHELKGEIVENYTFTKRQLEIV